LEKVWMIHAGYLFAERFAWATGATDALRYPYPTRSASFAVQPKERRDIEAECEGLGKTF
jgi:hypothetical protein